MSKPNQSRIRFNLPRSVVTAAALIGTTATLAACGGKEKQNPAPAPKKTETVRLNPAVEQQVEVMNEQGKAAARTIISILRNPKSGTEPNGRTILTNKASILGPDKKMYTADDQAYVKVPETTGRFYPSTGRLYLGSTGENPDGKPDPLTGIKPLAQSIVVLDVAKNNPIYKAKGQITPDVLDSAVDSDSSRVVSVKGSYDKGFSSQAQESNDAAAYVSSKGKVFTDQVDIEDLALGTHNLGVNMSDAEYTAVPAEQVVAIQNATQALGQATYFVSNQANSVLNP